MAIILDGGAGITTPHITSAAGFNAAALIGTVPSGCMPAGNILQVITRQLDGTTQAIASAEAQLIGWSQTITKIKPDSKIVCFISFFNYINSSASTGWWQLHCKVGTNPVSSSNQYGVASHNPEHYVWAGGAHQAYSALWHDTRNQSTITYDFFHIASGACNAVWWNQPVNWIFYEVAA